MTRGRLIGILLALWLLGLGIVLQPRDHPGPIIRHAKLLDQRAGDLPTLTPLPTFVSLRP